MNLRWDDTAVSVVCSNFDSKLKMAVIKAHRSEGRLAESQREWLWQTKEFKTTEEVKIIEAVTECWLIGYDQGELVAVYYFSNITSSS